MLGRARAGHAERRGVVRVYTIEEVASMLRLEQRTVLRLIKRGYLKALPGIRHKRITEVELERYLNVRSLVGGAAKDAAVDSGNGRHASGSSEGAGADAVAQATTPPPPSLGQGHKRADWARQKKRVCQHVSGDRQ